MKCSKDQAAALLVVMLVAAVSVFMFFAAPRSTGNAVLDHFGMNPAQPWNRPDFENSCQMRACYLDTDCGAVCGRCSWSTHTCIGLSNPQNGGDNVYTSQRLGQPQQKPSDLALYSFGQCIQSCNDDIDGCVGAAGVYDGATRSACYDENAGCAKDCEKILNAMPRANSYDKALAGPWTEV
jgi:hypothetical protein